MRKYIDRLLIQKLVDEESLSTCAAKHVGCIIFDRYTILAKGYNRSVVPGMKCCSKFRKVNNQWLEFTNGCWQEDETNSAHKTWSITHEVHAEIAALIDLRPTTGKKAALVTYSPCLDCCKSLIAAGITTIYYVYDFDNVEVIQGLCTDAGVHLIQLTGDDLKAYETYRQNNE